jgi:hypothetical protein
MSFQSRREWQLEQTGAAECQLWSLSALSPRLDESIEGHEAQVCIGVLELESEWSARTRRWRWGDGVGSLPSNPTEHQLVDQVLALVTDANGEVKSVAVKTLATLIHRGS